MAEYELYHHGVKGMKWGVRRKKTLAKVRSIKAKAREQAREVRIKGREDKIVAKAKAKAKAKVDKEKSKVKDEIDKVNEKYSNKKFKSNIGKSAGTKSIKSIADLSNEELKSINTRLNLENNYKTYMNNLYPETKSRGKKFAEKMWDDAVIPACTEVGKNIVKNALNKAVESYGKDK